MSSKARALLIALVIAAFTVQALRVLLSAYPVMSRGVFDGSAFSLDFGAYYTSASRLLHNPSQLYTSGAVSGDPFLGSIQPGFKYLPFFSFFMLPLLPLSHIQALITWDVFQFILMPVMGLLLYRALKSFNVVVIVIALWIVLLQPLPFPPMLLHCHHTHSHRGD